MVNFDKDPDLGQTIVSKKLYCFGAAPLKSFADIVFAAGGHKFSSLCGFRFVSKTPLKDKEFGIAFVAKLRSKIYTGAINNRAPVSPSSWYIFKYLSANEVQVLTKKELLEQYGFDIKKFFDSDLFDRTIPRFLKAIDTGLTKYVPDFIAAHGNEYATDQLGGKLPTTVKKEIARYVSSIEAAKENVDDFVVNDKSYKLTGYSHAKKEAADELEDVLKKALADHVRELANKELNAKIMAKAAEIDAKKAKDDELAKLVAQQKADQDTDADNTGADDDDEEKEEKTDADDHADAMEYYYGKGGDQYEESEKDLDKALESAMAEIYN